MNAAVVRSALAPAATTGEFSDAPRISRPLLHFFSLYTSYYLRKHFHGLYLSRAPTNLLEAKPAVVYLNHASWWDPLVCLQLRNEFTHSRPNYAPIAANSLRQLRFFARLGFFGVEKDSRRGTLNFLHTAAAILRDRNSVLWVTPQGEFVDQRLRPINLKNGLAELAKSVPACRFIPLAIDYFFGDHRLPGIGLRFGDVIEASGLAVLTRHEATLNLATALEETQDRLRDEVTSKRIYGRQLLLGGRRGTGGIYGAWQAVRRRFGRERAC